jgi:hypothetical protein
MLVLPMPSLSHAMTSGRVSRWLKQPGQRCQQYDVLAEVCACVGVCPRTARTRARAKRSTAAWRCQWALTHAVAVSVHRHGLHRDQRSNTRAQVTTDSLVEDAYKVDAFAGAVTLLLETQEDATLAAVLVAEGQEVPIGAVLDEPGGGAGSCGRCGWCSCARAGARTHGAAARKQTPTQSRAHNNRHAHRGAV